MKIRVICGSILLLFFPLRDLRGEFSSGKRSATACGMACGGAAQESKRLQPLCSQAWFRLEAEDTQNLGDNVSEEAENIFEHVHNRSPNIFKNHGIHSLRWA